MNEREKRNKIRHLLSFLSESQRQKFDQIFYGGIRPQDLDRAIDLCERTLKKHGIATDGEIKFSHGPFHVFNPVPQNEEEVLQHGNALAASGNYPVGTSACFNIGISGGCGPECFVYQGGECEVPGEMVSRLLPGGKNFGEWSLEQHFEIYPEEMPG